MQGPAAKAVEHAEHFVQFYEEDPYLLDSFSNFLQTGFHSGEPVVVIATGPHREGLEARLNAGGVDVAGARPRSAA